MNGTIAALFRHPIKGFTPQKVRTSQLIADQPFPGDRLFAVEDGPCGFDPSAPAFISKTRFAVLAKIAGVARARTCYDESTTRLTATAPGSAPFDGLLASTSGQHAFAVWLADLLGESATGPLQVIDGRGHRFLDHPRGQVSIINLASVRDLERRIGRPVDPLRFRANVYVEGWPAWVENDWTGRDLTLGAARARVFEPITRCAAPGVDPATGERDMDVTGDLFRLYRHLLCGIYVHITQGGEVSEGDRAELAALECAD